MDLEGTVVVAVDDDPTMRRVLARVLGWRGCTVHVADGRAAAYDLVLALRPAVVTIDYELGRDTGVELADDLLRALGDHTPPFILVSAAADRIPRHERERFGAIHTKPFRASALLDDVERLAAASARKRSGVRAIEGKIAARRAKGE